MKKFIIGALVLLIGVPGFSFTFFNFLNVSAGLIPVLMIIGGAIAVYLGIEELKQSDDSETTFELKRQPIEKTEENSEDLKKESEPILDTQKITDKPNDQPKPERQQESASPSALPQQPAESSAPEAEEPSAESVQFKGNIETLVFHTVACNFASGKNCSMDFTTKKEAETQGYKPCKICMPDA